MKRTVQGEFAAELSDLSALGAEAKLRAKLEALQHATDLLNEDSSSAASAQHEVTSRSVTLCYVTVTPSSLSERRTVQGRLPH